MNFARPIQPRDTILDAINKLSLSPRINESIPEGYKLDHSLTSTAIHRSGIWRVLAVDTNSVLSASYDKTAKLFNSPERRVENSFTHNAQVLSLACTDKKMFTGSADGVLKIWDRQNDALLDQIKEAKNKSTGFYSIAIMGEEQIATGACQRPKNKSPNQWPHNIKIWKDGLVDFELKGHQGGISSLIAFENRLISSSADKTIKIWNTGESLLVNSIEAHDDYIYTMAALQPNQTVSGGRDKTLRIYDLETSTEVRKIVDPALDRRKAGDDACAHGSTVYDVCVLQPSVIASASRDGTMKIWDMRATVSLINTVVTENLLYSVCPIGHFGIAAGSATQHAKRVSGELMIWDSRI